MNPPRHALLTAKLLRGREAAPVDPPSESERARAIATVVVAMRAARRRRRLRYGLSGLAVAAAVAASVFGIAKWRKHGHVEATAPKAAPETPVTATGHAVSGTVMAERNGKTFSLGAPASLVAGDRVTVQGAGRGALVLSTGTQLLLETGGSLSIVEQGHTQLYAIDAGAVRAFVSKLGDRDRFIVRTSDAEIEVRGTSFRVSRVASDPTCGGGTTTRVEVGEGVVVVRAGGLEERVTAGQHWPKDCRLVSNVEPAPLATVAAADKPSAAPSGTSVLGSQNALYAEALAAKNRNDTAAALVAFDRFLAKYPGSELAESAAAQRLQILAVTDRKRAVTAAKEYLARYPSGPARKDAEAIVAKGEASSAKPSDW